MIDPVATDIGREVIYRARYVGRSNSEELEEERGVITSYNDRYVFVSCDGRPHGKATLRESLFWAEDT